jgi:predicted dienelactone hydrolase
MTHPVGLRLVRVDESIPTLMFYPTLADERLEQLGPFPIHVARDAPARDGRFPLVVISHGSGGTPATHRELARYLASRGFVVAVPEHPGNHRGDNSLADTAELLARRPRDVLAVADGCRGAFSLDERFSIVGHSMGAYTGLVAARDPRVAALVLLAPATPWLRVPGALAHIRIPILMRAAGEDAIAPAAFMSQIVITGVPDASAVDYRVIAGANHYAFLSPWPEAMRSPAIPPSIDPPGFDRRAFLDRLYPEIVTFLQAAGTRR